VIAQVDEREQQSRTSLHFRRRQKSPLVVFHPQIVVMMKCCAPFSTSIHVSSLPRATLAAVDAEPILVAGEPGLDDLARSRKTIRDRYWKERSFLPLTAGVEE